MYTHRFYRAWVSQRKLFRFRVLLHESDIEIAAESDLTHRACEALYRARKDIEGYITLHPRFSTAMDTVEYDKNAPAIVKRMMKAAAIWNVGPMAAVAGAIADDVGKKLSDHSDTVIVENGGDLFIQSGSSVNCALYAGEESPFAEKIGFSIDAPRGIGICTSSKTIGHSYSRGRANAVTVIAQDSTTADAAATAIANRINSAEDIHKQVSQPESDSDLVGVIACCDDRLASWGIRLFRTDFKVNLPESSFIWQEKKCVHCGACAGICPSGAFTINSDTSEVEFEKSKCILCGLCIEVCYYSAIQSVEDCIETSGVKG